MSGRNVKIGLLTAGDPKIEFPNHHRIEENGTIRYIPQSYQSRALLHNLLIGKDFHWQKRMTCLLPGEIVLRQSEQPMLINILDAEEYLLRVVGSEMNPEAPFEFLKAHAIISRSWLYGKLQHDSVSPDSDDGKINNQSTIITWQDTADHIGFDVCSDDHCQRYQGDQPVSEQAALALRSTQDIVLADSHGNIADCRFSKCCGGRTELFSTCWQNKDFDYLTSVECGYCNPHHLSTSLKERLIASCLKDYDRQSDDLMFWTRRINRHAVAENLLKHFNRDIGEIIDIKPIERGASGRISLIEIEGSEGKLRLGKELAIRRLLSDSHLYSSLFDLQKSGNDFIINGRGWGHGVGLCQIGAAVMALKGTSASEILSFYYPGTHLQSLS